MPPKKRSTKSTMSASHKEALAEGRRQGNAVRRYLVALDAAKPRRGRAPNPENLQAKLDEIEAKLEEADPLQKVHLIQERKNLQKRLEGAASDTESDLPALEAEFIEVAAEYGERKEIDYSTWREAGVPADVLSKAGIHWSRRS